MFEKKHLIEDLVCLLLGIFLGIILFYFLKTSISLKDSFELIVGIATIATLFGILLAKKSLDSTIESIKLARETLEEAKKATEYAQKSYANSIAKQKEEEKLFLLSMINSLLEELRVNFNICCNSFLKRFSWADHYNLFNSLRDTNNLYYSNPTDDINGEQTKLIYMLKTFYKDEKKYEILDFTKVKDILKLIFSRNIYPNDIQIYFDDVTKAFIDNPNLEIPPNIKYIIWQKDFLIGNTDLISYEFKKNKKLFFQTNLSNSSLEYFLSSGKLLSWVDENNKRLFVNVSELNFSIRSKFNLSLKSMEFNDFVHKQYVLWTHFRLVFLILDILLINKDQKNIFINQNFVNQIYKEIGI